MKNKKGFNCTRIIILCVGLLLAAGSIFCFFGTALKMTIGQYAGALGSVFTFVFGGSPIVFPDEIVDPDTIAKATPILMAVFIVVIIAILLILFVAIGLIAKKLDSNSIKVKILICAVSVLMLVGGILALRSKDAMILSLGIYPEQIEEYSAISIGDGIISFSIISFVSVAINVVGIILKKKV